MGKTLFWTKLWVRDVSLCVKFCRLFDLVVTQTATVVEMYVLGGVRKVRLRSGKEIVSLGGGVGWGV